MDQARARIWPSDAGSHRRRDAGSRQRRYRILQGAYLRRQQGELTGYFLQIRLLGSGALHERHQHVGVLFLRRLNVAQSRPDNWIRYEDRSRWRWWRRRKCSDAIVVRRGEAAEVRQGELIGARQGDPIEIRQREASETRQGIGGDGTNDGEGGQGHRCYRRPARGRLRCSVGRFVSLYFLVQCFGHPRFLRHSREVSSHRRSTQQKSHRGEKPAMALARLPTRIPLKSWTCIVNIRLFPSRPPHSIIPLVPYPAGWNESARASAHASAKRGSLVPSINSPGRSDG